MMGTLTSRLLSSSSTPLPLRRIFHGHRFTPTDSLSTTTSPTPSSSQSKMRPFNIPPPPLAPRATDPVEQPPTGLLHSDPWASGLAASESLWSAEYASSNRVVVVSI